ncbi:MAG: AAA family ATPase [Sedimentisphaerales bacterium]|jgi:putative ATP-dependent endonuclease of OLD family
MYLSNIKLWNFRKFGSGNSKLDLTKPDLIVSFTKGLNVLIGANDSGKTAIIDAIKFVLDTHSSEWVRLIADDFHNNTERLRIECRFDELSDNEAMHFIEWLGMEGMGEAAKPYLKVILDASKKGNERLHYDVRAGADDDGALFTAEARDYLRTTYLKPLRDAKSELVPKRNSRLSQILSGHHAFKGKEKGHTLTLLARCWNCLFKKYFKKDYKPKDCTETPCPYQDRFYPVTKENPKDKGSGNKNEGESIRADLQDMIKQFFEEEQYQADFDVIDRELKNILEQFKLSLSDDKLGLGSQNLLFIAAELLNLKRQNWTGLRLALIEELEAHLHPQAQLRVIEFFEEFIKQNKGVQIILTTHSPNLASKVELDNLIICHDKRAFPMRKKLTELEDDDYVFLERFLDVTKANLFFAKGVILVEGWSEELLLPVLAKKVGIDLTQKGVSIINVGNMAFLRYAKIFRRKDGQEMNVPIAVITDLDVKPEDENITSNGKTQKEIKTAEIKAKYNGQKVKTFPSPHWTLEYCISKSSSLSAAFESVVRIVHPNIIEDCTFEQGLSDKLIKRTLDKTEIAYKLAQIIEQDIAAIAIDENDQAIKYLIDAIKYVTA